MQDLKAVSSERTVAPYCTTGCILTQPMTIAITHTASQRCTQPKPSAHSSKKKKKKLNMGHRTSPRPHYAVSLRLAGHSEDGRCRSTSCTLPLSHHHMTIGTVSQLGVKNKTKNKTRTRKPFFVRRISTEPSVHWLDILSPRSRVASVELISHRTRDNSCTHTYTIALTPRQ